MSAAAGDTSYVNKIDCEVVDYQLVNSDPSYYNNHIFMIKVWIQKHMYAIDRSYAAFCDLDARLRKQYARSNIPLLKLAGASMTTKLINSTNNLKESKKNLTFPPESDSDRAELKPLRRVESSEIIAQKKKYLTSYLQGLLKIPEIVLSDILLFFLDEESTHGEPVTEAMDEQSDSKEIHIVLKGLEMTTRMVRADRQQEVSVPPNHFVVWSFNTLNHDVGFSIAYKEKEILKYQRYDSHQKLIMGHFEMPEAGTVRFVWDNSYSRWRSKTVNYVIKVVCPEEYMAAQATAAQMKKDRLLFLKQRGMVKTALVALSTNILSSRGNSIAAMAIPAASTTLLSTSTSSPSLAGSGSVGGSGRAAEELLKRTSSAKEVHTANTNNTSPTSTPNTNTTPATSPAQINCTSANTSSNNTITNTNTTNATNTTSSYWEFADMSEAVREINRLRNEKKTLQQALSESETALVTERSIAAQVLSQFDAAARKKQALEEELGELKGEFDVFRENYFNEMESRLAETLATFEVYNNSNNNHNGSTSANASPGKATKTTDESGNHAHQKIAGTNDALTAAPTAQSLFGAHDTTKSDESDTLAKASPTITPGTADDADTVDVSLNQLISLTSTELSRLSTAALVSYFAQLSAYTQTMLRRGYLTRDMEAMVARLKNEKKQLKAYAIQMKTNLDGLTLRYIHLDQDRAVLLAQVKELKDLVVLLETDRRGLREHIAALSGADSDKNDNAINSSGEGAGSGIGVGGIKQSTAPRTADSSSNSGSNSGNGSKECVDNVHAADLSRTGSNTSAESTSSTSTSSIHDQHATVPSFHSWVKSNSTTTTSNTYSGNTTTTSAKSSEDESFSLGVWLNSGLASASAAMSFEGFDFGESHYHGASSSGNGGGGASGGRDGSKSVRSSSGVLSRLSRAEDAEPMDAPTSTIIISMEDLQQASLQSTSNSSGAGGTMHPLQALRSLRAPYEYKPDADMGSDCGYSVCDEDHAHASLDPLDQALHRAHSNTSTTSNTSNISSNSNDKPPLASTSSDSGGFTKVTEQLYGILPSWGQIQKLRSSSLI